MARYDPDNPQCDNYEDGDSKNGQGETQGGAV